MPIVFEHSFPQPVRQLLIVLGDQLNHDASIFDEFDPQLDLIYMAEVDDENTYVPSHQLRITLFLSAMRHFRDELNSHGFPVWYHELSEESQGDLAVSHEHMLLNVINEYQPQSLLMVPAGDDRVQQQIESIANQTNTPLRILEDRHFYCSTDQFSEYARKRKSLLMEYFYRHMRQIHDVLMDQGEPVGGKWNLDHDNRDSFTADGPSDLIEPPQFQPDKMTQAVLRLVKARFADHPGVVDSFNLAVTRQQALQVLDHFIQYQLPLFGRYEDAMWQGEPFLYHSRLSYLLNLKLLNPRECVDAAVEAYHSGHAPLNSVEGFVRQLLGWREFIRGIYWLKMPEYAQLNALDHQAELPEFFWTGETEMACVRDSMHHVLNHGYAHHIHRLMVLGNLSLMLGVHPYKFHEWHLAMYLDAIDWVSLPNTLGMSQYGDGGIVGTKPYCSSGNYINKMSNYCVNCRYNFKQKVGENACPFSTLYYDFLNRHYDRFSQNRRMNYMLTHVRKSRESGQMKDIQQRANELKAEWGVIS